MLADLFWVLVNMPNSASTIEFSTNDFFVTIKKELPHADILDAGFAPADASLDWCRLHVGSLAPFARATANDPQRHRSCIVLWMNGGPSTIDMWDLKPNHENGGPFREIDTNVLGVRISEHLPRIAGDMPTR